MKLAKLFFALVLSVSITGQSSAEIESTLLSSSRSVTPVKLISVATATGYGVRLEYGQPCLAEGGNRLRKLEHNFGKKGFMLVQYQTPYAAKEGQCPSGTLFFVPEKEATTK